MPFIVAGGHRLEYVWIAGAPDALPPAATDRDASEHDATAGDAARPDAATRDAPVIVFLHEGLGSLSMWKDFPSRLCAAAGCRGLLYSRHGYGRSDPLEGPRTPRFMHDEATIALPELLDQLDVDSPILFGHSDGGSIALLHAALAKRPVRALIVMAPHVLVEDLSIASIAAAKRAYETTDLRARLARYHDDPDSAFRGWNDIWLHPHFRDWNIEDALPAIRCPILAMQGIDDEYGTMEQVDRIARGAVNTHVALLKIPGCGHSPHRDRPAEVIRAAGRFIVEAASRRDDAHGAEAR